MQSVRFIYGKCSLRLSVRGTVYAIPSYSVVATYAEASLGTAGSNAGVRTVDFHSGDFQSLYPEVAELLDAKRYLTFHQEPVRVVESAPSVIDTLGLLAGAAPQTLFRFLYSYCLALDRTYFSELLRYAMSGDAAFAEFLRENYLNQWSVERFAQEFDMPVRKFDVLFREKYGVSAKRWLLETRLAHARELLLSTSMRVLDIALECGFSNHAHFTDTFRKRFLCSPTQLREREAKKLSTT